MYLLWILGQQLERRWARRASATLYFTALLCGSFGALVQTTDAVVVGASGAVFGLMGALRSSSAGAATTRSAAASAG